MGMDLRAVGLGVRSFGTFGFPGALAPLGTLRARWAMLGAAALGLPGMARAEFALNLPAPATSLAHRIFDLHSLILWICLGIFVVVFVPMGIAIVRHRKSRGHAPYSFHDHPTLELAWTVVPVLILVGMAWPATSTVLAMKDTSAPDLTIKVTGHQWKWEYEYLGEDVRFFSSLATPREQIDNAQPKAATYLLEVDRPLVVPTGRKVRLVLTATDVIHSWWIPAFGVKQDAIPGFLRDSWFTVDAPGTYRGQCAELCGVGHGFMPIVVEALPPERYATWLQEQKAKAATSRESEAREFSLAELKARGEKVYKANCVACHQANGGGIPGTFPALDGSPIATGPQEAHLNRVFNGKPGTAMAAFGQQLSDLEIAAVISYERNAWHNASGVAVQPADIAKLRTQIGSK